MCLCPLFFLSGQYCTENVDECELMPNACQNGGTCHDTHGSYHCVCVNGWTGDDCSENIDDCASAACYHGATCHDRVASFFCECPHGRTGTTLPGGPRLTAHPMKWWYSLMTICSCGAHRFAVPPRWRLHQQSMSKGFQLWHQPSQWQSNLHLSPRLHRVSLQPGYWWVLPW